MNLSMLTEFCMTKEARRLLVSQAAESPDHQSQLTPSLAHPLHPLGTCQPLGLSPGNYVPYGSKASLNSNRYYCLLLGAVDPWSPLDCLCLYLL